MMMMMMMMKTSIVIGMGMILKEPADGLGEGVEGEEGVRRVWGLEVSVIVNLL